MTGTGNQRRSHAVLDVPSRELKAKKIERLLRLSGRPQPFRLLEIGTGSGGIAHYFATHPDLRCDVTAVDVCDNRTIRDGYEYRQVIGVELPFDGDSFDVVISNHVIEHVGDMSVQWKHLAEMHRVMKVDGVAYLAVPNRWMLVEPHYRLPFLSWLPERWRTPFLRWSGRGVEYDCRPLTSGQALRLLDRAGFRAEQQCAHALRLTFMLERPHFWLYRHFLSPMPDAVYEALGPIFPTLIYVLTKREGRGP